MSKFADLRQEYKKHQLNEENILTDPLEQFRLWFHEALDAGVMEPNAFTLATVSKDGTPSARVLLLKGVDENGLYFILIITVKKVGIWPKNQLDQWFFFGLSWNDKFG